MMINITFGPYDTTSPTAPAYVIAETPAVTVKYYRDPVPCWPFEDEPELPNLYQRKLDRSRAALADIVRANRDGGDSGELRSLGSRRPEAARDPRRRPSTRHHGWRESELAA